MIKIYSSDLQIEEQDDYKYKFSVTSSGHAQNLKLIFIVVLALQSEGCQQLMNQVQHLKITRMHNAHGQVRVSIHNNNFIMNLTKNDSSIWRLSPKIASLQKAEKANDKWSLTYLAKAEIPLGNRSGSGWSWPSLVRLCEAQQS